MTPLAKQISAMLTGKVQVTAAIGRPDYADRFQPFGTAELEATCKQNAAGQWEVSLENAKIPFTHSSPRIITLVGIFVFGRWYTDLLPLGEARCLEKGDVASCSLSYTIQTDPIEQTE